MTNPLRPWRRPGRLFGLLGYILTALPVAVITFTVVITLLAISVGLMITFFLALPFAWLLFVLSRGLAHVERSRIDALLNEQVVDPVAPDAAHEPADGRVTPARLVVEHVVADQRGDRFDLAPRKGEPREQPFGEDRALGVVADEVAVRKRCRLTDVVQQGRQAQPLIRRIDRGGTVERGQAMEPQIVARDLVLLDADLRRELRQRMFQDARVGEDPEGH